MNPESRRILEKQHYGIVGEHSAVKLCHWLKQSMLHGRQCYKQSFYGIKSHRCLQMTPAIDHCTQMCLFCWRSQNFTEQKMVNYDDPESILEGSIAQQRRLITGFKGDPRCSEKKWEEANDPNMLACSLSGEPTLYPRLGEFFELCHRKDMTTFLVTNGTTPDVLQNMSTLPKQLYVSVTAPDEETYKKLDVPLIPHLWDKLNETLEIMPSLDTRTVIRHTLVADWNMSDEHISNYARLIEKAQPDYVEPKGYVFVGHSRKRLSLANMPTHDAVRDFALRLGKEIGYELINEKQDSRVTLLARDPSKDSRITK